MDLYGFLYRLFLRDCGLFDISLVWDHYRVLLHVYNWKRIVFSENDSVVENFKNSS